MSATNHACVSCITKAFSSHLLLLLTTDTVRIVVLYKRFTPGCFLGFDSWGGGVELVVCNAVFRLSISCSVPEIFAIEVRSRAKSRRKKHVFRPPFFGEGEDPQILDLVFLNCTHFRSRDKVSRRSAERPRRSRSEEKRNSSKTQRPRLRYHAMGGPNDNDDDNDDDDDDLQRVW